MQTKATSWDLLLNSQMKLPSGSIWKWQKVASRNFMSLFLYSDILYSCWKPLCMHVYLKADRGCFLPTCSNVRLTTFFNEENTTIIYCLKFYTHPRQLIILHFSIVCTYCAGRFTGSLVGFGIGRCHRERMKTNGKNDEGFFFKTLEVYQEMTKKKKRGIGMIYTSEFSNFSSITFIFFPCVSS